MPKKKSKLDTNIDAGKFFLALFQIAFLIGAIAFSIWFYFNVYKPEEKSYIKGARYAYKAIQDEVILLYKEKGYVFNPDDTNDSELCHRLTAKYANNNGSSCYNTNPLMPQQNFIFNKKKISVYGLEKPAVKIDGNYVKDIIIDTNTEIKGDNTVGSDKTIFRIYSSGSAGGIITPVNCSKQDEKEYGMTTSNYCAGSPEINYLALNIPLGFDIEQIGAEDGKSRIVTKNTGFARADCRAFDGYLLGLDEYCSEKMLYIIKGCDYEYTCNIKLTEH